MSTTPEMRLPGPWVTSVWPGDAATFHARDLPGDGRRHVWVYQGEPAVVLGSSQDDVVVDHAAASEVGYPVVCRRSGGGVVLVDHSTLWIDLVIPRDDPLWQDDIGESMLWVGACWAKTLASHGVVAEVYDGAYEATPLSRLVCFGGLGAGEVCVDGAKLVGISQRRTRAGARFQCALLREPQAKALARLVVPDPALGLGDIATALVGRMTSLSEVFTSAPLPTAAGLTTQFLRSLPT